MRLEGEISHVVSQPACPLQVCDLEGLLEGLDEEMGFYGLSIGDLTSKGVSYSMSSMSQKS